MLRFDHKCVLTAAMTLAAASLLLDLTCKRPPVNAAPETPSVPAGISSGGCNTTYEFVSVATDPDSDSVAVRFFWGDSVTSDWSDWAPSGNAVSDSHSWSSPGTYLVKTQAKDRPGATSDWSEPHTVTINTNLPPGTPGTPHGPTSMPKDSLCTYTTIASDPNDDGICYRFNWGNGDTSEWTSWVPSGTADSISYRWDRGGSYAVRSQAKDVQEATSVWSNHRQVVVVNLSPFTPEKPYGPGVGKRNVVHSFTSTATDPDGDSIAIRFEWGDDTSDWSHQVPSGRMVTMSHVWTDTGVFLIRARAQDAERAMSGWSVSRTLTVVNNQSPSTPEVLYGPTEGARNVLHVFSSSATDPDGDSVAVRFDWGTGDTSHWSQLAPPNHTISMGHVWLDTGVYSIRAQAGDKEGATSGWSATWEFYVSRRKWQYPTGASRSSPAVAADGTVYVGSMDHHLYALNPDGSLKWRYETDGYVYSSPAIGTDGTVYVGSADGNLHALEPDGSLAWQYRTGNSYSSPAIAADGTVYVGSADGNIYALNPDGSPQWQYQTSASVYSSPAIAADGTIYVGTYGNFRPAFLALNPDGSLKWRYIQVNIGFSSPAIAADGTIHFGSEDDHLYAINPDSTLKWRHRTGGWVSSSSAIAADGTIYVGSQDGYLYAVNPDSTLKWRYGTGGWVSSSPAISVAGTVYIGSEDGYLYAINPGGSLKWRYLTGSRIVSSPAIAADGTIYIGSYDGYLYSIEGDDPLASTPWPKSRHDSHNTGRVDGQ